MSLENWHTFWCCFFVVVVAVVIVVNHHLIFFVFFFLLKFLSKSFQCLDFILKMAAAFFQIKSRTSYEGMLIYYGFFLLVFISDFIFIRKTPFFLSNEKNPKMSRTKSMDWWWDERKIFKSIRTCWHRDKNWRFKWVAFHKQKKIFLKFTLQDSS